MSTPKTQVTQAHPRAVARPPNRDSLYPNEWTVRVPPVSFGFSRVLGHGTTAKKAWANAAKQVVDRIYRIPGSPRSRYATRRPVFPCTVFAPAINNGAGTPCPDKKAFDRICDFCSPHAWSPSTS